MTIVIQNKQKKIPVNIPNLKTDAQIILDALNYSDFDLGILLTSATLIKKYNKQYRHKDKPTDILSFAYHQLKPGQKIKPKSQDDKSLGDLIICPSYVMQDVKNWNQTFNRRMQILLVHGICHLLGYDHETDADYKKMKQKEESLLKKLPIRE